MDITPDLTKVTPWQYRIPANLIARDPYADILKSLLQGGQDIQQGQDQQKANQLNEILGYLSKGYQPGSQTMPNPQIQNITPIPQSMPNPAGQSQNQGIGPVSPQIPNPQIPQTQGVGPMAQSPLQSSIPNPQAIGGIYNQGMAFVPKPPIDKLAQEEALAKYKVDIKPELASQAPYTDEEVAKIVKSIVSKKMTPTQIMGYKNNRSGSGPINWEKINNGLQSAGFNLSDYSMRWNYSNQPQIRSYLGNIDVANQEIDKFQKVSDEFSRTGIGGLNKLLAKGEVAFGGVTASNYNIAKESFAKQMANVLGQAGIAPTDSSARTAQKLIMDASTPKQINSALQYIKGLLSLRKKAIDSQGLQGMSDGTEPSSNAEPFVKQGGALDVLLKGG